MSSSSSTLPWKKVDIALLSEPTNSTQNHNDDAPSASSSKELEAGEAGVAMFFGLEMIHGDEYTVTSDGKLQPCVKQKATDCKLDSNEQVHKSKKRKADARMKDSKDEPPTAGDNSSSAETEAKKPKKKKKKKKRQKISAQEEETVDNKSTPEETVAAATTTTGANMERLQTCWMMATGGVQLHSQLCTSLLQQDFWTPTPIQAATLAPAILGRRNIVGAAPTGSGKTLGLPLAHTPITTIISNSNNSNVIAGIDFDAHTGIGIASESRMSIVATVGNPKKHQCATLVGGLALAKQARMLQQHRTTHSRGNTRTIVGIGTYHSLLCVVLCCIVQDDMIRVHLEFISWNHEYVPRHFARQSETC